jgi:hypothetical protein
MAGTARSARIGELCGQGFPVASEVVALRSREAHTQSLAGWLAGWLAANGGEWSLNSMARLQLRGTCLPHRVKAWIDVRDAQACPGVLKPGQLSPCKAVNNGESKGMDHDGSRIDGQCHQ